jgi:hypothetical protein
MKRSIEENLKKLIANHEALKKAKRIHKENQDPEVVLEALDRQLKEVAILIIKLCTDAYIKDENEHTEIR